MIFLKFTFGLMLILLSGCSFLDLHADLKKQDQLVTITGEITAKPDTSAPVIIVLIKNNNTQPQLIKHKTQKHPGKFTFITTPGSYQIFAFEDANRDGKYTVPERAQRSETIDATSPGSHHNVDITIASHPHNALLKEIADIKEKGLIRRQENLMQLGSTISLDSPHFSTKNASKGLWQPYAFVRETPFGLFFLKDYDPSKKIILFIHGVSGSPSQFAALINNLDHDHFQALIFYYPSGFPIPLISQYLNSSIEELHVKLGFESISVVAHSMGGLVSRGFINIQADHPNTLVDCFISISTPWNGHAAASSGLKYAPVVIPVWRDVAPGSEFLETLFTTPAIQTPAHYLLFGFKGSSRTAGGNSDGVVSIASQLRPVTQKQAEIVRGYDEGHVSILKNEDVAKLINQILEKHLERHIINH